MLICSHLSQVSIAELIATHLTRLTWKKVYDLSQSLFPSLSLARLLALDLVYMIHLSQKSFTAPLPYTPPTMPLPPPTPSVASPSSPFPLPCLIRRPITLSCTLLHSLPHSTPSLSA